MNGTQTEKQPFGVQMKELLLSGFQRRGETVPADVAAEAERVLDAMWMKLDKMPG